MGTEHLVDAAGFLTPWGQGQMEALARRHGWVSYPGAVPFLKHDGNLSDDATIWLTHISQRGSLPQPASTPDGLATLLSQYGVV